MIADLPADRQARIDARYRQMEGEVERPRKLRRVAGKDQTRMHRSERAALQASERRSRAERK